MPQRRILVLTALLVVAAIGAVAAEPAARPPMDQTQSFENGMPAFVTVAKGTIGISESRVQDGRHALRWDWVPGDVLTFATGPIGNVNVWTGYGNYSRSAFGLHIFTEVVGDGALTFRWLAGDRAGACFDFPLVYKGWQRVAFHYSYNSRLKDRNAALLEKTDRIVVEAPKEGAGGTVFFDSIDFNKPIDFRDSREPVAQVWKPLDLAAACQDPAILAPPTQQELDAITRLSTALATPGNRVVAEKEILAIEQRNKAKYALERHADGTAVGKVVPNLSASVSGDLQTMAQLWLAAGPGTDAKIRKRIEEAYFLLDDFFRDAGAVAQGNIGDLSWYGGRSHGSACFIMQEPLRRSGRLERVRNCLKYHWAYDSIFKLPEERKAMGMDYFYIDTNYMMRIALMHDTPRERVSHLRAFIKRFNRDIINTVEVDGSVYHHGFYNFPYVSGAIPTMANQINQLATTPFAVSREAFERAKLAVMDMRWFCNLRESPIFMHGRHPGRLGLSPPQYLALAEAGRVYQGGRLDRDLATAYLRLVPAEASKPVFTAEGITAEPAPQGNQALNYAALMGHRRGEWLAVVRGYSRYLPAQESYDKANRHGLFLGNGYLDILATGSPINISDSGCDLEKGWDWRNLDGTTSYAAPYARIANGNGTMAERSDAGFVGGLSHRGRNGLFVMSLHSRWQHGKSLPEGAADDGKGFFTASKSYAFFDGRIVCLGSGIALPGSPHPVRTTLFQKNLKTPATPIRVDTQSQSALPWRADLAPATAHTLMDIQDTGYYLPAGQAVTVIREHQKSRAGHDEKDTEGDAATAFIDHGTGPAGVGYTYVACPRTTPEQLARFVTAMGSAEDQRPLLIRQQDARAHIILDRATRTWGCVFFAAQPLAASASTPPASGGGKNDPPLPIAAVSQPCLVMAEGTADGAIAMTVCDPDLHLDKGTAQTNPVVLELENGWRLKAASPGVSEAAGANGASTITIACREGRSYGFELKR